MSHTTHSVFLGLRHFERLVGLTSMISLQSVATTDSSAFFDGEMRMETMCSDMTIRRLSKRTGVIIETIRYYERVGLLPAPPRTEGGHRLYEEPHLRRLTFIRRSRELGFPLDETRGLLQLVDGGNVTCAEVEAITLRHLDEVRRKIADLKKLERVLSMMAAQCDGSTVPECPVIDALFGEPVAIEG